MPSFPQDVLSAAADATTGIRGNIVSPFLLITHCNILTTVHSHEDDDDVIKESWSLEKCILSQDAGLYGDPILS